jgi:hypothetical protein
MNFATITVFGLSMLTVPALSGCVGASEEEGAGPVGAAEEAVTNVTLNAVAYGN